MAAATDPVAVRADATTDVAGLLKAVVDGLPVGVAFSGPGGRPLYANRAAMVHAAALPHALAPGGATGSRNTVESAEAAGPNPVEPQPRIVRALQQAVMIAGQPHEVTLSTDVTEQQQLEDDLFRRAYFDELTGLPNRILMERTVNNIIEASDSQTSFALAFIDIDHFKHINDYYGHDVGDGLLVKIAGRIAETIRDTDMLARVGGDELLLLLSPLTSIDTMNAALERILVRLKEPFFLDGHEIFSSASIGVSLFPQHGRDYSVLRGNADNAMYRIKSSSKGSVKTFDPQVGHAATERMKLEQRLRMAIRDRRLCCAFQPKFDFRADTIIGLEVLLRWRDEEGVIQAPGDFVDLAVELGLMDDITLAVLAETVRSFDRIDEAFGSHASISINVAAKQANDVKFMRSFVDALNHTGQPSRFMVELTEEAFLAKTQFQTRVLPMLREIGARVSIDDFGVGFSSLSALADITADEIKVDRSFITSIHQRPRNQSILGAIESLGQSLGMSVIVEGVETFEELAYLQATTRIRLAQGFYFSKPVMLDEVEQSDARGFASRLDAAREPVVNRQRRNRTF